MSRHIEEQEAVLKASAGAKSHVESREKKERKRMEKTKAKREKGEREHFLLQRGIGYRVGVGVVMGGIGCHTEQFCDSVRVFSNVHRTLFFRAVARIVVC